MQSTEPPDEPATAPSPKVSDGPYAVLRNRDFVLYLTGRLVATFGQAMFVMALGWELYERTHSAFALGLVGLTQVVPMVLFTLPAGHPDIAIGLNNLGHVLRVQGDLERFKAFIEERGAPTGAWRGEIEQDAVTG